MRRVGDLFDGIVTFENLMAATKAAARGKRSAAATARFLERAEFEALALRRELIDGTWQPGKPTTFTIRDPKVRVITAVPFRDRVVHHAVMSALAPVFDRRMIAGSFACRRGKGSHAAVTFAHGLLRKYGFFLKLDIQKCFESLDHDVVLGVVSRVVKDRRVLALLHRIVSAGGDAGRGLPIGSLTSQWLANLTLDRLDHHVKEVLRIPGYVRYMDDFVLFSNERESLRATHVALREFLRRELRLAIKEKATLLAPARHGLPFLGFSLHRGTIRVRPESLRRLRRRLRRRDAQLRDDVIDESRHAACVRSIAAHLSHADTLRLRRRLFSRACGKGHVLDKA